VKVGVESKINAPKPEGNNIGLSLVLEKNLYEIKNEKGYVLLNQIFNPNTFVVKSFFVVKKKTSYKTFDNYFAALKSYKRKATRLFRLALEEVLQKNE